MSLRVAAIARARKGRASMSFPAGGILKMATEARAFASSVAWGR